MSSNIIIHQNEEVTVSELERRLQVLDSLMSHPGWKLCRDIMQRERDLLDDQYCDPNFPESKTAYARGALFTSKRCINLPEALAQSIAQTLQLEADVGVHANDPA
jgi:hypothetical protein